MKLSSLGDSHLIPLKCPVLLLLTPARILQMADGQEGSPAPGLRDRDLAAWNRADLSSSCVRGAGSCVWACSRFSANCWGQVCVSVLAKRAAKALQGCRAHSSHLPMARASRLVVATTSLVLALMKICRTTNETFQG